MTTDDDDHAAPSGSEPPWKTPDAEKRVKDMIDAATRAELEKWFGLPSYQEVEERGEPAPEDPDLVAARQRREQAIAAVDPALLEAHRKRTEPNAAMFQFRPTIDVVVDPLISMLDMGMVDRQITIGEPRQVEISDELQEDLRECTPQALLRDLHRAELDFEKTFEVVDMAADQRFDIVAAVAEAMATRWKLTEFHVSPFNEGRALLRDLHAERQQPWTSFLAKLPNRRRAPDDQV